MSDDIVIDTTQQALGKGGLSIRLTLPDYCEFNRLKNNIELDADDLGINAQVVYADHTNTVYIRISGPARMCDVTKLKDRLQHYLAFAEIFNSHYDHKHLGEWL